MERSKPSRRAGDPIEKLAERNMQFAELRKRAETLFPASGNIFDAEKASSAQHAASPQKLSLE